jgi:probable HAF family extracellular repeat protein
MSGFTSFDPPNSTFTLAVGINDNGNVTGYYYDSGGNAHAFIRAP